jgi:hypothetical protein
MFVGFVPASALLRAAVSEREELRPRRYARVQHDALRRDREPRCAAAARLLLLLRPCSARVRRRALGAWYYELRFRNGYVTGIVATRRLDRFLSYGVHLERFARAGWYGVPHPLSQELGRLTVGLRPLRIFGAP